MHNITEININEKLPQMMHLLQSWTKRNITPLGRITVLKSLILSKITHILISLPAPNNDTFKNIEKMCTEFIWKGGRHEVSKKTLYRDIKSGGLNMVNIRDFETSLKLTWIRRLISGSPDWTEFAEHYCINQLYQTDEKYHELLQTRVKNKFWLSVIIAYSVWFKKLKLTTDFSADNIKIWGNPEINIHFNTRVFDGNIRYVSDLYDNRGIKLSQRDIEVRIDANITFIEYHALYNSIPGYIKDEFRNKIKTDNITYPTEIHYLTKDKKGTRNLREIFNKCVNDIPIGQSKWNHELSLINVDWNILYLRTRKCNMNARMHFFNYQVLHHTLITNKKLHQFGLADSDLCEKCGDLDTITHLLYECRFIIPIWKNLERWISRNIQERVECNNITAIMGINEYSALVNYIFIICKHEIFKSKWSLKVINQDSLLKTLKEHLVIEEYISTISNRKEKTLGKWSPIYNLLKRLK